MKQQFWVFLSVLAVSGCAVVPESWRAGQAEPAPEAAAAPPDPTAETAAAPTPPPANARTADEFDTTSAAERADAVAEASSPSGERDLGRTVASLGAVGEPGIWLKTPLVSEPSRGRIEFPDKGTRVAVDLIPIDGEPGSGSRISLAAMRLIEADLTSLPELRVYVTGGSPGG